MITQNFAYLKYQKYSEFWVILAHGVRSEKPIIYSDMLFCYHFMFLNHLQFSKERSEVQLYINISKEASLWNYIFALLFSYFQKKPLDHH